jgi:hypothetical protein
MKIEPSDKGKKLSNLPQSRFPEAITCNSAKKNIGEHKALLLKDKPSSFNEYDKCHGPCKEPINSKLELQIDKSKYKDEEDKIRILKEFYYCERCQWYFCLKCYYKEYITTRDGLKNQLR